MSSVDVDDWFTKKSPPLAEALQLVRSIILGVDSRIEESIKWQTPTFSYKGNMVSFNPAKNLVSLLFHRGALIPGDHPKLEGTGATARVMRFADLPDVEAGRTDLEAAITAWCHWRDHE